MGRKKKKDRPWAVADFETTTDLEDCRVWGWSWCPVEDNDTFEWGTDIDSFMLFLYKQPPTLVYFHNLAFDGNFIMCWLFENGYTWVPELDKDPWTFTTLISDTGKFYSLSFLGPDGQLVEIRDSLKLFPMSVRALAKAFDLPEGKGDIDYRLPRPVGYEPTSEEVDYMRRDVQIVAKALAQAKEQGMRGMTIGANCMTEYKEIIGQKRFKHLYPTLDLSVDAYIRRAYRGGFTYVNPKYAEKDVGPGISVDFNSMYPSMLISKDYPIGDPMTFSGRYEEDPAYPLYIQSLTASFKLKPDHVPMVQLKNRGFYGEHEYVTETVQPESLTLTSVDLALLFENYDVDVYSYDGGMKFMSAPGERLFGAYVEKWGDIKRHSKGGRRALAKLYLNNLYGKFSTNPDVTPKIPIWDQGKVTLQLGAEDFRDPVYLPVGAFCTAYARDTLIRAILRNFDRFVYCDTDSMHLLGTDDPEGIRLHDTDFCAWKVEGQFEHARHLRTKAYIWDLNGKVSVTCAGMPDNVKELCTFDNFHFGFTNANPDGTLPEGAGKLLPKRVPGGIVLVDTVYVLHK